MRARTMRDRRRAYLTRCAWPGRAARAEGSAAAAERDGAVDVLDRDIDPAEILNALGAGLAQRGQLARLHHIEEVAAIGGARIRVAAGAHAFDAGERPLHAGGGGGEVVPA